MGDDAKTTIRAPILAVCSECADAAGGVWPAGHVAMFWTGKCDACCRERACCAVGNYDWRKGAAMRLARYREILMAEHSQIARPGTADIRVSGPCDGMGDPDLSGAYIQVRIATTGSEQFHRISIGAAEVLAAELMGLLHGQ